MDKNTTKNISIILTELAEDICENYCKYYETADEDCICDAIREKGGCPLDILGA